MDTTSEPASHVVTRLRAMLLEGMVNAKDQWLCDALVNRTPEAELTGANRKWLCSLLDRNGEPFLKTESIPS